MPLVALEHFYLYLSKQINCSTSFLGLFVLCLQMCRGIHKTFKSINKDDIPKSVTTRLL